MSTTAHRTGRHLIHDTTRAAAGNGYTIALTVWSTHVQITTFAGATTVDTWTGAIPATTPQEWQAGCAEASRIRDLFNTHGGPDGIEAHANGLRIRLAQHTARPQHMQDHTEIAAIHTELAALEDLGTRRVRDQLVTQFNEAA